MKIHFRQGKAAIPLFTLTLILFLAFFLYMATTETVSVYHAEQSHGYGVMDNMQMELIRDDSAPAGVRKVYRGILEPESAPESCLCFNIAHNNIHVYFDDVLVYSLTGAQGNRIGRNVSSNWCCVHVGQAHAGETVTVVLTPLFEAASSKEPTFLLGSHYSIAMDQVISELPLLILSTLCILLGMFVFAVFLYFRYVTKTETSELNYLGLFSAFIGLWKLTDLRCMPLLIPQHSMVLGYVSVGSLFLTSMCLLPYFGSLFAEGKRKVIHILSGIASLVCLLVLAMQLLGIGEIRENLVFSHILLITAAASIPLTALYNRIVHKTTGLHPSWTLLLLLLVGIALDLILYYRNNDNGLMSFSIIGFIIYTLIIFLNSVQKATRKAYTDSRTGLVNRTRWNELMNSTAAIGEPFAILVLDLNGLKRVNDTLGHDAGDQLIFRFSSILRNTLPRTSVICRWGGDEFTILLTGVNRSQLDQQMNALLAATEQYNADSPEVPIHFAMGAALSSEHPELSRAALFQLADEAMYRSKQSWYSGKRENL